ncbi:MAG: phosphotransferase [Candidatus Micrarchaeota archaeon]
MDNIAALAAGGGFSLIETHISWVLLGEKVVYKVKKPVSFSFLDFSTLEKRRFFCEEEVRLNRRLAQDVYLGVVPLYLDHGRLSFEGSGEIAEYAVKMKRLPEGRMMDRMLSLGTLEEKDVRRLAGVVADFHMKEKPAGGEYNSPEMIASQIADLSLHRDTIEKASGLGKWVDGILSRSAMFIRRNGALLRRRMEGGMVRDCHGDLHSANVFFEDGIKVVDCIEFSRDFRCIDVASDVAFMAMDLDYAGREDLSSAFVEEYISRTQDPELETLLPFYKCYRANVRAKISAIEWLQRTDDAARQKMDRYVLLAESYAKRL